MGSAPCYCWECGDDRGPCHIVRVCVCMCVFVIARETHRVRLSALYKELVLLMKSPWQMGLFLEVSHNHWDLQRAFTHTHIQFPLLLLSVPLTVHLYFFSSTLFTLYLFLILSSPLYPPFCARLLFIDLAKMSKLSGQNCCHAPAPPTRPSYSLRIFNFFLHLH